MGTNEEHAYKHRRLRWPWEMRMKVVDDDARSIFIVVYKSYRISEQKSRYSIELRASYFTWIILHQASIHRSDLERSGPKVWLQGSEQLPPNDHAILLLCGS